MELPNNTLAIVCVVALLLVYFQCLLHRKAIIWAYSMLLDFPSQDDALLLYPKEIYPHENRLLTNLVLSPEKRREAQRFIDLFLITSWSSLVLGILLGGIGFIFNIWGLLAAGSLLSLSALAISRCIGHYAKASTIMLARRVKKLTGRNYKLVGGQWVERPDLFKKYKDDLEKAAIKASRNLSKKILFGDYYRNYYQ